MDALSGLRDDMRRYDPAVAPDPSEWLALDEQERIDLVRRFHRRARLKMPNATLHAAFHAIVENQLTSSDSRVHSTLERLIAEGLDRHEAIHAIGSVLAGGIWTALRQPAASSDLSESYYQGLEALSASTWLRTL
jgi:hypothetical protein